MSTYASDTLNFGYGHGTKKGEVTSAQSSGMIDGLAASGLAYVYASEPHLPDIKLATESLPLF
jgi:hypothetical protein